MLRAKTILSSNPQPLNIMGDKTVLTDVKTTGPAEVLGVLVNNVLFHLALSDFQSFYLIWLVYDCAPLIHNMININCILFKHFHNLSSLDPSLLNSHSGQNSPVVGNECSCSFVDTSSYKALVMALIAGCLRSLPQIACVICTGLLQEPPSNLNLVKEHFHK